MTADERPTTSPDVTPASTSEEHAVATALFGAFWVPGLARWGWALLAIAAGATGVAAMLSDPENAFGFAGLPLYYGLFGAAVTCLLSGLGVVLAPALRAPATASTRADTEGGGDV
jgi:hypothetical protein